MTRSIKADEPASFGMAGVIPLADKSPPARAGGMTRSIKADEPASFGMAGVIPLACARGLL